MTLRLPAPFAAALSPPSRTLPALVAALCLALAGCTDETQPVPDNPGGVIVSGVDEGAYRGAEPAAPYRMPDVTLTSTNGRDFDLETDTGYPVTLVFFGYTHCPDVCQLVMSDITSALVQLPDDVRDQTQLVFITSDPARDTPEALREYLDRYDTDYVGLTGDIDTIVEAADAMGVAIEGRKRLPSGGYEVAHGAQIVGFRGDEAPVLWTEGTSVPDLVDDIVALAS